MRHLCAVLPLLFALVLAGCLPGQSRRNATELLPSDSASVAFALAVPVDTLALVWAVAGPEGEPTPLPTSLAWLAPSAEASSGSALVVAETQGGSLRFWRADGAYAGRADLPSAGGAAFPYVAGTRGDSVLVFNRGAGRLDLVLAAPGGGAVVGRSFALPPETSGIVALREGFGARVGADEPALVRLSEGGVVQARYPLAGPSWRAHGFVRAWGDSLLGLTGYRPLADLVPPGRASGQPADTLAFAGFSSPQLARSAQYLRGDAKQPPLLTSSAVALGDRLYVLNVRLDHVRVDVYGRQGRLERVLVSPGPYAPLDLFAVDFDAREAPEGGVDLVVLLHRAPGLIQTPAMRLIRYRWSEG